jgi:threonine dehydratase
MTVSLADIQAARGLLKGIINPTPTVRDAKLSNDIGAKSFLKAECLQRGGSFKVRGAYNKISQLSDEEKARGVITASAGNHAQGVGLAAKLQGVKATIVLPEFAPLTKVIATKALGADVILHGDSFDAAVAYSRELGKENGYVYVHAFDDPMIVAGQGSVGCEIVEDLPDVTTIVVPIGGGGICSGTAIAAKSLKPDVTVIGVQAANVASMQVSIDAGEPIEVTARPTIADGIAIKRPGEVTLPLIRGFVDEIVQVSEEEIAAGIYHCVLNAHLVAEGAGAAGVAALLAGKIKLKEDDVVCTVLCGGNIDGNLLSRVIEQVLVRKGRYVVSRVLILDRPGAFAALLKSVAETGASVIETNHKRAIWLAPLGYTGIELILEVRDSEHASEVYRHLEESGYHVQPEGQGDWEL